MIINAFINSHKVRMFVVMPRRKKSELEWLKAEFTKKTTIYLDREGWIICVKNSARDNDFVAELVDSWGYGHVGDVEYHEEDNEYVYWLRKMK